MEPVHTGRDEWWTVRQATLHGRAAMEPVHTGRDETASRDWTNALSISPQWSPSTRDGTSPGVHTGRARAKRAAMEPVHTGRDERVVVVVRAAGATCRNGARPHGTGRAASDRERFRTQVAAMEPVHTGRDERRASRAPGR